MHITMLSLLLMAVIMVDGDLYMHNPRGSNNRANEQTRPRANAHRLFDSQNNERGGYNVGGTGEVEGTATMTYTGNSLLKLEWTNQHQCGGDNAGCDIIIQYMCDDEIRDGTTTTTIPEDTRQDYAQYGRHESQDYYADCKARLRNERLYHADQTLQGFSAKFTRQNPAGTRRGLECPEERDYYPYHHPTPWRDIVIFTNNLDRCDIYRNQSQNVQAKGYCKFSTIDLRNNAATKGQSKNGKGLLAPILPNDCNSKANMKWVEVPAHGIEAPECRPPIKSRDNHLGNTESPNTDGPDEGIPKTPSYLWKIPNIDAKACVLRIRYNISVGDYHPFKTSDEHDQPKEAACKPSLDIGSEYGLGSKDAKERGYVFKNDPVIKPFKNIPQLTFQLAIDTSQTGRCFQDRSHKFGITKKENVISSSTINRTVHNLNVMGKRGNIVQVFPAVEYGFEPAVLKLKKDDFVHCQWTGSLRNPANNAGEGKAKEDKSNMILLQGPRYLRKGEDGRPDGVTKTQCFTWDQWKALLKNKKQEGHPGNNYPLSITKGTVLGVKEDVAHKLAFPMEGNNVRLPAGSEPVIMVSAVASSFLNNDQRYAPALAFIGGASGGTGFFISNKEANPWVRLVLKPVTLSSITILNRRDGAGERLRNIQVRAGMASQRANIPVVANFHGPGYTKGEHFIPFTKPTKTKYLDIQLNGNDYLQINGIRFNENLALFKEIGCFRSADRVKARQKAVAGDYVILDAPNVIQRCADKAKKAGNVIFSVQATSYCYTDSVTTEANAAETYAKYGTTTGCYRGRGRNFKKNVYKIVQKVSEIAKEDVSNPEDLTPASELSDAGAVSNKLDQIEGELDALSEDLDDEVFMEREKRGGKRNGGDAAKLDHAPVYVNLLPMQATTCQSYHFVCTRNNNFSNRSQKGKIVVQGC